MVVSFDWPEEPPPNKSKKRDANNDIVEQNDSEPEAAAAAAAAKVTGFAAVTGMWSNDITIYKGRISKDTVAAVLKGANPHTNAHGCGHAHSEVIYSLKVIGTPESGRLALASASLDGTVRTWELYSSRTITRGVKNKYVLKKPRKGAGDWTCASVIQVECGHSYVKPSEILVVEENATIAIRCDDRVLIYCRGRFASGGDARPDWSYVASLRMSDDGPGQSSSFSVSCVCVLSTTELLVGRKDGRIEMFRVDESSSDDRAWGRPKPQVSVGQGLSPTNERCSNAILEGHTESVSGIIWLSVPSLPGGGVTVSTSGDKTLGFWRKVAKGKDKAKSAAMLKGFPQSPSHLLVFPETQEVTVYSAGFIYVLRINKKEGSSGFNVKRVAALETGPINCATQLSPNTIAVGFMNVMGAMGIKTKKKSVQIWRRDADGVKWSTTEKDAISGLPNSVWSIQKVSGASDDPLELQIGGGGGNGVSFVSTWQETEDGWKLVETISERKCG
eukprot:CAMPEP_0181050900 /NCGR_PEP_ID=MMETSP1070-20121207/16764_1 /TAXON_ID=265543 /ORGANISM="Minutocellus polymorphus, Strain NH13" /LENGTH=501 /DNA_ID=CAMNT_0023129879 /DNA_START=53 /DNA_END=1558 /DNA_ORIENTATION=+